MYPVSASFLQAIRYSHVRSIVADVYFGGAFVVSVPVIDGSINVDRTQATRRQGSITVGDPLLFPTFATSALAPYGAEIKLYYVVTFPSGVTERCPLGVFPIRDIYEEQATGGMPVVDLRDRSSYVASYPFFTPYDASGVQAMAAINKMISVAVPDATVTYDPSISAAATALYLTGGTTFSSDRWSAVQSIAAAFGAEAYFDVTGNVRVVPIPALTQAALLTATPVWTFDAGSGGVLVTAKRTVSRDNVYNAVYGTGGSTGSSSPAVWAFASDNDPRSPTYYGPAGQLAPSATSNFRAQVLPYNNTLITTSGAMQTAVNAQLQNYLGLARSLNFTAIPAPMLEAGDVVKATYSSTSFELHVLDNFVIPCGPGSSFTGQTRTVSYQLSAGT